MSVKAFNISVDLDVQAVTCPGVWLCPNGEIILKLCMFGSSARTSHVSPIFPLLYHQKFIFQKTFQNVRCLTDLQHLLGKELIHAELIQCSDRSDVILASFETTVFELLFPSPHVKNLIAGVDVDLLMTPTGYFPGILAPMIQVLTSTMIEEVVDTSPFHKRNPGLINPKMLSSKRAKTLQDSPTRLPISTSASEREYNPHSHYNSVMDPALGKEHHQTKWRKTRKDQHCKTCQCCKCDESHSYMMCNCPVCCTYKAYFGKHCIDGCPTTQAIKPCKHACTTSKKCKQSEFHSFSDRRCCASDEVRMAGAVHHDIHNNLNASRYYRFIGESLSSLKYPCNISEQRQVTHCGKSQYREEFYRDLENFYRKLNNSFK